MMRTSRSRMLAAILGLTASSMALISPAQSQVAGCAACGPGEGDQTPFRTCCDPALQNMSWGPFTYDENPSNPSFLNRYGVKWWPTNAFHAAMQNTRTIVHIMLGSPAISVLVMDGDMQSDNNPADSPSLSSTAGPNDAANHYNMTGAYSGAPHNTGTNVNGASAFNRWMAVWWNTSSAPGPQWPALAASSNTFGLTQVSSWPAANTHMRSDNTIYALHPTFWVYYRYQGGRWLKRMVICNNLKDRYAGFQRGGSGLRMAAGAGAGQPGFVVSNEAAARANMRLGAQVSVTPDEVKRLESLGKEQ